MKALEIEDVDAFLRAAELASFTRAAQALGSAQSLVSTRVKRLEDRLGRKLLERHPRLVRLTADGEAFLPTARELMAAHGAALAAFDQDRDRIALGVSEQAIGPGFPAVLARLGAQAARIRIDLRIERSQPLELAFERGELDAVIIRRIRPGRTGDVLCEDALGWYAAAGLQRQRDEPVPLVSLMAECGLRSHGAQALDRAGIAWREAVVGGGMAAVAAAIAGGLGVSPLARRVAPAGTVDIGPGWGLPALGRSAVVLRSQVSTPGAVAFVRALAAGLRSA